MTLAPARNQTPALSPSPALRQSITSASAHIHYEDVGAGETAFIFLHYWGGSSRTWRHVIRRLAPHARCIAMDLRGWGASTPLDGRYDMEAMADDVLALVRRLDLTRYALVGHSMGGKVAQIVARRLAKDGVEGAAVGMAVARTAIGPAGGTVAGFVGMVLVAPSPPGGMPVPAAVRAQMLASYQSAEGVAQALGVLAHGPLAEDDRQQVVADTLRGAALAKSYWTEAGMTADIGDISGLTIPVRILVGSEDHVERAEVLGPLYAGILPAAEFQVLEGVGHLSPLEAPEMIARGCADFMRDLARAGDGGLSQV